MFVFGDTHPEGKDAYFLYTYCRFRQCRMDYYFLQTRFWNGRKVKVTSNSKYSVKG